MHEPRSVLRDRRHNPWCQNNEQHPASAEPIAHHVRVKPEVDRRVSHKLQDQDWRGTVRRPVVMEVIPLTRRTHDESKCDDLSRGTSRALQHSVWQAEMRQQVYELTVCFSRLVVDQNVEPAERPNEFLRDLFSRTALVLNRPAMVLQVRSSVSAASSGRRQAVFRGASANRHRNGSPE